MTPRKEILAIYVFPRGASIHDWKWAVIDLHGGCAQLDDNDELDGVLYEDDDWPEGWRRASQDESVIIEQLAKTSRGETLQ